MHSVLDDTLIKKAHTALAQPKYDDFHYKILGVGSKAMQELNVDARATAVLIGLFYNYYIVEDIYEGIVLSLLPSLIMELLNDNVNDCGQPHFKLRLDLAKSYLKHYLNLNSDSYKSRILSNFYKLWERNESNISKSIVEYHLNT